MFWVGEMICVMTRGRVDNNKVASQQPMRPSRRDENNDNPIFVAHASQFVKASRLFRIVCSCSSPTVDLDSQALDTKSGDDFESNESWWRERGRKEEIRSGAAGSRLNWGGREIWKERKRESESESESERKHGREGGWRL